MAGGSAHTNKKERNKMTPEQKTQLVAACESGDDVRIVTVALQVCAWLARNGRQLEAIALRNSTDDVARTEHAIREHKKKRLEIASLLFASSPNYSAGEAVRGADLLVRTNEGIPTPYCKDEDKCS